jgi:hypothetical protein
MYPFCKGTPESHGAVVSKTALFPFEARHISPDGKPMIIESMKQLRDVERHYGVVLSAFSKDNIRDVDPIKNPPRYRGEDPDFRR